MIDPPLELEPEDLDLLVRVVGWKRRIEPAEIGAAARLVAAGLLVLEYRGAEPWGEATDLGFQRRGMGGDPTRFTITMSGFFGSGARRRRNE